MWVPVLSEKQRAEMGAAGRKHVEKNFSREIVVKHIRRKSIVYAGRKAIDKGKSVVVSMGSVVVYLSMRGMNPTRGYFMENVSVLLFLHKGSVIDFVRQV